MPKRQQPDQPLTQATVASYLAVTELTLARWIGEGRFPTPPRNPDGSYAIDPAGLVTWLRSRYIGRPGPPDPPPPALDSAGQVTNPLATSRDIQRLLRITSTQLRWLVDSGQAGAYDLTGTTLRYDPADPALRPTRRQRARVRREPRREPVATLLDALAQGPLDPHNGTDLDLAGPAAVHALGLAHVGWRSVVPLDAESIGLAYVIATLSGTYVAGLTGSVATDLGLPSPAKRDHPLGVTWQGDDPQATLDALRRPGPLGIATVLAVTAKPAWTQRLRDEGLAAVVVAPSFTRTTPTRPLGLRSGQHPPPGKP